MPRLTLLIGPAGCGKTHRVLTEAAECALTGPLPTEATPPLLVIVPEQQAAGTERALLARIAELSGAADPATTRLRVMSLTRLARVLAAAAGKQLSPLGDLGRRLLIWRMLDDGDEPSRRARAEALSDAVAELALYGTTPADLEARAAELAAGTAPTAGSATADSLPEKLRELARVARGCHSECAARGLDHTPAPALVPELLNDANWPYLGLTRVWVDGFAGFTPAEESALLALLRSCVGVTATVLLDPTRIDGPLADDTVDWYAPTRATLKRWQALAADAPLQLETVTMGVTGDNTSAPGALPRWPAGSPLATLAYPGNPGATTPVATAAARAMVLASERAEVDCAARTILDLANRGYRFGEISVITRDLEPYADLVATRFLEHGIPCYLDRRESVAHHPLVEQLRCGIRLALGQAAEDDIYTLLKGGLLAGGDADEPWPAALRRDRADRLENYARAQGLKPGHWLRDKPWDWCERLTRRDGDDPDRALRLEQDAAGRTAELDGWRRELLAPVTRLRGTVRNAGPPTVATVLTAAWSELAGDAVQTELEHWASAAESALPPRPGEAARHRGITGLAAALFDELHSLAGDLPLGRGGVSAAEFCTWLEYGLGSLSLGQPPLGLDAVLVTAVERGRHHPVRAALLLGLAEDAWPPPALETALFSDAERLAINDAPVGERGRGLTGPGAVERGEREPYLALVALTRASEFLQLTRPGADRQGGARPPSPFYKYCLEALAIAEEHPGPGAAQLTGTPLDLAAWAGIQRTPDPAYDLLRELGAVGAPALSALTWGLGYSGSRSGLDPLGQSAIETLSGSSADGKLVLRGSSSRLEAFAACPFKHYARYFLGLKPRDEALFDQRTLGSLYHEVLQLTVEALNRDGYAWPGDPREVYARCLAILDDTVAELAAETGRERTAHLLERARLVLWHQAHELCARLAEHTRRPLATELRIGGHGAEALPPLVLEDDTLRLELSGFIDRLDGGRDGLTVVDYKFKGGQVRWEQFLAGTQIQLFAYLLATAESNPPTGAAAVPKAVEYQPIEITWQDGQAQLAAKREPPVPKTDKQAAALSDLLGNALSEVRRIMLELCQRLLGGEITPLPLAWQHGKQTACGFCDYREVCRFDPLAGERYREVIPGRNDDLRKRVAAGDDFTGSATAAGPGSGGAR